jgi:predicted AAA+ superfamily ATPase
MRAAWFESYVETILQRDVRDLARREQLTELPNLLQMVAARSASRLNLAELSRASGLTQTTPKRWFSLLETLFLVVRIPAWPRNPDKRLVKAPKVYLPDSGMLAWPSIWLSHAAASVARRKPRASDSCAASCCTVAASWWPFPRDCGRCHSAGDGLAAKRPARLGRGPQGP